MSRPISGSIVRGSTSRLIKSVSVADKEKISSLMSELNLSKTRSKEQDNEMLLVKEKQNQLLQFLRSLRRRRRSPLFLQLRRRRRLRFWKGLRLSRRR